MFDPARFMPAFVRVGFAEPVSIAGKTIDGVFERRAKVLDVDGMAVDDTQPTLTCQTADLPPDPHDETATIRGEAWLIIGVEPDGVVFTRLRLRKI